MRILIIGAGAVGGYFGARLASHGRDVTFLVRPNRAEQLRKSGLDLTSPHGNVQLTPKLLLASELAAAPQAFDLIVVSTKAYSLEAAINDFAPAVGPASMVMPLLNGYRHLDILIDRFGKEFVVGGSTRIVTDLDAEGHIHQFGPLHDMTYGELDLTITPRIQALDATMRDCGFPTTLAPNIFIAMWTKWCLISHLAATTCLLRGSVGAIAAAPGGPETVRAMLAECAAITAANGYPQEPAFLHKHELRMTEPGSALTASMFRDLQRGGPIEADHILGDFLARGAAKGVEAPLLRATYAQLKVYSNSLHS
jgi:2-dehydropantoate 2-reductase